MKSALAALMLMSCATTPPANPLSAAYLALLLSSDDKPAGPSACPEWIKLEGEIDDPSEFVQTLALCKDRAVLVEINSPGGSLFGALEIQKAIERHPMPVLCMVDGMAASAAFVTLQSCDLRAMTDRSILMAHHAALNRMGGQSHQLANGVAALEAIDRGMALHCAKRMGMTPEEYESHVSGGREWWMGMEPALTAHAVDFEVSGLTEALKLAASASKPAMP